MSVGNELPEGWVNTTVGEIASSIQYGHTASATNTRTLPRFLRITDIQDGQVDWDAVPSCDISKEEISKYELRTHDIVFARTGATTGKSFLILECPQAVFASYLIRLRMNEGIYAPLVQCFFNTNDYWRQIEGGKRGIGQPNVNASVLADISLSLPPLPEQHRIVEKIEELFSDLDAGVASLQRAKANLKRYRSSVLKSAVEGRLTEEWRKEHPQAEACLCTSPPSPSSLPKKRAGRLWGAGEVPTLTADERSRLPSGWLWAKVRDLGPLPDEVVQVGPMSMRSQDFEADGVPVMNVGCVQWGGFNEDKLDFMPQAKASAFDRYRLRTGDILFTRSGTVGRSAVAMPHQDGWLMTFHLLRVRCDQSVCLPTYLQMVFQGASHVRRQTREASIGSTRAGFNTRLLADLDVPLPPLAEQEHIVALVEERLSQIDSAEKTIDAELIRSKRLRQSILKRAFEGKLTPQDPKDEPASVLLERIKASREAEQPRKKAKKATQVKAR